MSALKLGQWNLLEGLDRIDADFLARPVLALKSDPPVGKSEKRVVPAHPHIVSRVKFSAKLANYDISGTYEFAAEFFYAPALTSAVASVSGTPARFLMRHDTPPKNRSLERGA